jgi:hypothetical protein
MGPSAVRPRRGSRETRRRHLLAPKAGNDLRVCLWPAHAHQRWATKRRCISADARRLLPCTKDQEYSQRAQLVLRPQRRIPGRTGTFARLPSARSGQQGHRKTGMRSSSSRAWFGLGPTPPSRASVICDRPFVSRSSLVHVYVREWFARGGAGPPDLALDDGIAGRRRGGRRSNAAPAMPALSR